MKIKINNILKLKLNYLFLLLISITASRNVFSQDSDNEPDIISRFRPGVMWFYTGLKPATPERVRKYDRLIFDVVHNDWQSEDVKPFKVVPSSIGFNTNLMFDIPLTEGNTVSFGTGLAYGFFHVRMNDFLTRNSSENSTKIIPNIGQYGIEKSVFNMNTLSIPLELRFRGKNWKHAKLHIGGKFTYQFHASTILSSKYDGIISQQKTVGFYDLNPINASAHIRVGIRNWSIFASYGFMPIFKNDLSTKLNPLQFGISVSLF